MAKVTVAIPTYNRESFLKQSIQSVLNQTFQDFEIIVFDDASDYSVEGFLTVFKDPRISFLRSPERLGGNAKNFQRIFEHRYNSEYLVVFHDDDFMHPRLLESEFNALSGNESAVWVGTGLNFIKNPELMEIFEREPVSNLEVCPRPVDVVRLFTKNFHLCFSSVMYRVSSLENILPFQIEFDKWADRPFLVALCKKGPAIILKGSFVNYRLHPGQDSQINVDKKKYFYYTEKLFNFYYKQFAGSVTEKEKQQFFSYTTNSLILFAVNTGKNLKDFFSTIKHFQAIKLFDWKYLNYKGLYYLGLAAKKIVLNRQK